MLQNRKQEFTDGRIRSAIKTILWSASGLRVSKISWSAFGPYFIVLFVNFLVTLKIESFQIAFKIGFSRSFK